MGYACYELNGRDQGYGVPAECDHPDCNWIINRGIGDACGGDPQENCGLFFCQHHKRHNIDPKGDYTDYNAHKFGVCERCRDPEALAFDPKPDIDEWIKHKMTDDSWADWRNENPDFVKANTQLVRGK